MTINRGLDQTALDLINLQFSVIPTNGDKKATISWKEFQTRIMTTSEALILKKANERDSYTLKSSDLSGCMDL
jgi:hypothetical protein